MHRIRKRSLQRALTYIIHIPNFRQAGQNACTHVQWHGVFSFIRLIQSDWSRTPGFNINNAHGIWDLNNGVRVQWAANIICDCHRTVCVAVSAPLEKVGFKKNTQVLCFTLCDEHVFHPRADKPQIRAYVTVTQYSMHWWVRSSKVYTAWTRAVYVGPLCVYTPVRFVFAYMSPCVCVRVCAGMPVCLILGMCVCVCVSASVCRSCSCCCLFLFLGVQIRLTQEGRNRHTLPQQQAHTKYEHSNPLFYNMMNGSYTTLPHYQASSIPTIVNNSTVQYMPVKSEKDTWARVS